VVAGTVAEELSGEMGPAGVVMQSDTLLNKYSFLLYAHLQEI
jgi:hypothetical protein